MKKLFAAGTFEGVYPMPVKADSLTDLFRFIADGLKDHIHDSGLSVNLHTTNAFLANREGEKRPSSYRHATTGEIIQNGGESEYLPAEHNFCGHHTENDYGDTMGTSNLSFIDENCTSYRYMTTPRYSNRPLFQWEEKSLEALVARFIVTGFKGTLVVSFRSFPDGMKCHPKNIKTFRIVMGY